MMRRFSPVIILALVLAACAAEPTPTLTPAPSPVPPATTPLPLPTATATLTSTPLPPPTETATGTLSRTPTGTASHTGTPTPPLTPTASMTTASASGTGNPTRGKELFHFYTCDSCHDVTRAGPAGFYAPSLGNLSQEAERIIRLPEYMGTAKTPAEYIRESVLNPNVYLVPGDLFLDAPGVSAMVQDFAEQIPPADLDDIIAYLLTLDVE